MNIPISSDSVRLWATWRCPSLFHCLFTNVNENDSEGKLLTPRFCCKWRKRTTGKPKGAPNSFGIRRNNEGDAQSTRQERLWHGTGSHDEGAEVLDPPPTIWSIAKNVLRGVVDNWNSKFISSYVPNGDNNDPNMFGFMGEENFDSTANLS